MPCIIQASDGKTVELNSIAFSDEAELETVIVQNPNILRAPGDAHLKTVARRITLPDAGIIDVFLTDEEGLPIVVEVKLARNRETRRQIVAQIFDYVSDLSLMNADEIDDLVDAKLGNALQDDDQTLTDRRWKAFGRQLKEGGTRFVLAVDETPESLDRIMEFLRRHTNLDVRLVEIHKHQAEKGGFLFVPEFKVVRSPEDMEEAITSSKAARPVLPELQDFFDFVKQQIPSINVRPGRYAIVSLGAGCQARIEPMNREGTIRVSFKSHTAPRKDVEDAIRATLGDPDHLVIGNLRLERKFSDKDPDIIWWATNIDLAADGGFGSQTLRQKAVATFTTIENAFRPVAQKIAN